MDYNKEVNKAREFALKHHSTQKYGIYPYEIHLGNVVSILMRFGVFAINQANYNLLAAAWLHDILEDTPVTMPGLEEIFGKEIAYTVYCVTDEEGQDRNERKAGMYKKLVTSQGAIIIKLADRIANAEFSLIHNNIKKLSTYKSEQVKFNDIISNKIETQLGKDLLVYLEHIFEAC